MATTTGSPAGKARGSQPSRVLADRYELTERIGVGGMAEVWRGRDRRLDRDVAVKLLAGPAVRDPSRRRRIEREARTLASLSDPGIVAVYDYGEETTSDGDVMPFVVMELVDGPDLHNYLRSEGRLSVARSQEILRAVGCAVASAHDAGVVHGDLKPANVFIDRNGPKVGDFGVARVLDEETGSTTLAATPAFAAPEVLRGARPTPASDVYSLACLAFEMLTGHPPYEGANAWEVAAKHLEAPIPSARVQRPDVDVRLDEAIRSGMQKDPRKRPGSVAKFVEMLGSAPTQTVPVVVPPAANPDATEALPSRPDLERVAVLGPLAGLAPKKPLSRTASRRGLIVAIAIGLFVPLFFLLVGLKSAGIAVPDVHGQTTAAAAAALQRAGFSVSDVSYDPITQGQAGIVVRTIPGAGTHLARGASVHVIATALQAPVPTPTPLVDQAAPTTSSVARDAVHREPPKHGPGPHH